MSDKTPGLPSEWGVLLDDLGSVDIYKVREQADAARHYAGYTAPLVRVDYTVVDPGSGGAS